MFVKIDSTQGFHLKIDNKLIMKLQVKEIVELILITFLNCFSFSICTIHM